MSDVTPLAAARWRKRNAVQGVKDALAELRVANRQLAVAEGRPVPQLRLACGHGAEGNSEQDEGCRAEDAPTHPLDAAEGSAGVHGHDETPAEPETGFVESGTFDELARKHANETFDRPDYRGPLG